MPRPYRSSRHPMLPIAALLMLLPVAPRVASSAAADGPVPVRVERVRPAREKLPSLRFLRTNRDFFRARLDLLRETPLVRNDGAQPIDPRFLAFRDLLSAARAAGDSVSIAADADQRRTLFASVTELGQLEAQLDQMDRLLAAQRTRLASLQEDFAGQQRTALAVVVSGLPRAGAPAALALTLDDGTRVDVPLSDEARASLANGGVLEVFHGLIEPREQSFEIALATADATSDPGFVTLTPERDQLTFLRLDLAGVDATTGAAGIAATMWRHDAATDMGTRSTTRP